MKKRFNIFLDFWENLIKSKLFVILAILFAVISFIVDFKDEDWSKWYAEENDYQALEQVLDNMIKEKNFIQPLSNKLSYYKIEVNKNSWIDITLYGDNVTIIKAQLDENLQLKSLKRENQHFDAIITFVIIFVITCVISYVTIFIIYIVLRFLFRAIYIIIE